MMKKILTLVFLGGLTISNSFADAIEQARKAYLICDNNTCTLKQTYKSRTLQLIQDPSKPSVKVGGILLHSSPAEALFTSIPENLLKENTKDCGAFKCKIIGSRQVEGKGTVPVYSCHITFNYQDGNLYSPVHDNCKSIQNISNLDHALLLANAKQLHTNNPRSGIRFYDNSRTLVFYTTKEDAALLYALLPGNPKLQERKFPAYFRNSAGEFVEKPAVEEFKFKSLKNISCQMSRPKNSRIKHFSYSCEIHVGLK